MSLPPSVLSTHPAPIAAPPKGLAAVVVIPCYDEAQALKTHHSLMQAQAPSAPVEIIWVINSSAAAPEGVLARNAQTAQALIAAPGAINRQTIILQAPALPPKHAGVGLARRIGMDLAAARLKAASNPLGPILCLDGDCTVSPNYLRACLAHFEANPKTPGASIHYEHPLEGDLAPALYEGIARYELHLRVYVHGLRFAGLPFAFQTVGSSMAVRGGIYTAQGGMNKRKAGEDFYFLHKIMQLGAFTEIAAATVYPSPRVSHRVPFGTGRAMGQWLEGDEAPGMSYDLQTYKDLGALTRALPTLRGLTPPAIRGALRGLSPALRGFLNDQGAEAAILQCQANSRSAEAFRGRFYRFFDGFKVMRFANISRGAHYPPQPIEAVARGLLALRGLTPGPFPKDAQGLLNLYRALDQREAIG